MVRPTLSYRDRWRSVMLGSWERDGKKRQRCGVARHHEPVMSVPEGSELAM
jgi:hypothetical protein